MYGGLKWTANSMSPKTEFWTLLHSTMDALGPGYVAIGASEMARLSKQACQNASSHMQNYTATCAIASQQSDCSF